MILSCYTLRLCMKLGSWSHHDDVVKDLPTPHVEEYTKVKCAHFVEFVLCYLRSFFNVWWSFILSKWNTIFFWANNVVADNKWKSILRIKVFMERMYRKPAISHQIIRIMKSKEKDFQNLKPLKINLKSLD